MKAHISILIIFMLFSLNVIATPEEEDKQFALQYQKEKYIGEENIPSIVEQFALTFGCAFHMGKESVVELKDWEESSYLAVYSLDLGCSDGSAMSRPYFLVLTNFDQSHPRRIFVNPKYSTPTQTSQDFPQTITGISIKNGKIYYSAREFDFEKDALCCPSVPVEGELVFDGSYWMPLQLTK